MPAPSVSAMPAMPSSGRGPRTHGWSRVRDGPSSPKRAWQSERSQGPDLARRFFSATAERSASPALLARTEVSRNEFRRDEEAGRSDLSLQTSEGRRTLWWILPKLSRSGRAPSRYSPGADRVSRTTRSSTSKSIPSAEPAISRSMSASTPVLTAVAKAPLFPAPNSACPCAWPRPGPRWPRRRPTPRPGNADAPPAAAGFPRPRPGEGASMRPCRRSIGSGRSRDGVPYHPRHSGSSVCRSG